MQAEAADGAGRGPWLPLTPRGAARFACRGGPRFWFVTLFGALAIGLAVGRLASVAWFPAIEEAVAQLPAQASLDDGRLRWPEPERRILADNTWLGLAVDPTATGPGGQGADLQVDFTRDALWVTALTGYLRLPYPSGYVVALDRATVAPLWEAWRPHLLLAIGGAATLTLILIWALLAVPLGWLAAVLAWLFGGRSRLGNAWRLAIASFFPGAILVAAALFLYSFRFVNVPVAIAMGLLHLIWTMGILFVGPWFLLESAEPEALAAAPEAADNPFKPPPEPEPEPVDPRNPFAARKAPSPDEE